jgi:hypothetical protein
MLGSSTAPRGLTASTALSASTRAAKWPHVLEHDAEARRLNDALAFAHQLREPPYDLSAMMKSALRKSRNVSVTSAPK